MHLRELEFDLIMILEAVFKSSKALDDDTPKEIKQKSTLWVLQKKKFLLTTDRGSRPVSSELGDQLATL